MGIVEAVAALACESSEAWDNASPEAVTGEYLALADECEEKWAEAVACLVDGRLAEAAEWLRSAARLEREGGDDATAQRALAIVETAM